MMSSLGEFGQAHVVVAVVAEFVAVVDQPVDLHFAEFVLLRLAGPVEELVRQDAEHPAASEIRMRREERFHDPDSALRVERELAVLQRRQAELGDVRIVEGQDDRALAGRRADTVIEEIAQLDHVEVVVVKPLQVGTELVRRAHELLRRRAELVVFQDRHLTELVRLELLELLPG